MALRVTQAGALARLTPEQKLIVTQAGVLVRLTLPPTPIESGGGTLTGTSGGAGASAPSGTIERSGGGASAASGSIERSGGGASATSGTIERSGGGASAPSSGIERSGGGGSAPSSGIERSGGGSSAPSGSIERSGGGMSAPAPRGAGRSGGGGGGSGGALGRPSFPSAGSASGTMPDEGFRVEFDDLTVFVPGDCRISVVRYSANDRGGSERAELAVTADQVWSIQQVRKWLGKPLRIINRIGRGVWVGVVNEVEIGVGAYTLTASLDGLANRVAVLFEEQAADGSSIKSITSYANDADSQTILGFVKTMLFSAGEATQEQAEAKRDELLESVAWPVGAPSVAALNGARVRCVGLMQTLDWLPYTNAVGRVEHIGRNRETINLGWALTSAEIGFKDKKLFDFTDSVGGLTTGDRVQVTGSSDNNALFVVGSIDEGLTERTATTISFDPADDLEDSDEDGFANFEQDAFILVEGSADNSGFHWIKRKVDNTRMEISPGLSAEFVAEAAGPSITLTQAATVAVDVATVNELPGETVTVTLVGAKVAQAFETATAFTTGRIGLRLSKAGWPLDDVQVGIYADSGGEPGAEIDTATITADEISQAEREYWITLPAMALAASTTYWIVVERTGTVAADNYFLLGVTDEGYETTLGWDGAAWQSLTRDGAALALEFRLWDTEDTSVTMERIIDQCGQFVTGVDVAATGVERCQYADNGMSGLDELLKLLELGAAGGRLVATVNEASRHLIVELEAAASDDSPVLMQDGTVRLATGNDYDEGRLPVGAWLHVDGAPDESDWAWRLNPFFVSKAEYTVGAARPLKLTPRAARTFAGNRREGRAQDADALKPYLSGGSTTVLTGGTTPPLTSAQIFAAVLAQDGAGSGLDADKLDGLQASAFALAGHDHDDLIWWRVVASSARLWGGEITDNGDGTVTVAAGAGLVLADEAGPEDGPTAIDDGQASAPSLVEWDEDAAVTLTDNAYNYIYITSAGAVAATTDFYSISFTQEFTVGRVYRAGTTVTIRLCGTNAWNFNRRVQLFGEEVFPVVRAKGLILGSTGTRNLTITAGILWAELVNRFTVGWGIGGASDFNSSGTDTWTYWYRNGSGGWTTSASATQINNVNWDDGDGTLGELTANRYGVHWVYVVHDSSVHVLYGQGNYTLAQAEASTPPASIPGLLAAYGTLIGRVLVQKSSNTLLVESAFDVTFASSGVISHNDLSDLTTGDPHTQYILGSLLTTRGDIIVRNATVPERLALTVPSSPVINFLGVANGETQPSWKSASSNPGAAAAILATDASGNIVFDTDLLHVDALNNRVTIGSTSGYKKFTVVSATQYDAIALHNGTNYVFIVNGQDAGNDDGAFVLYSGGSGKVRFDSVGDSFVVGGKFGLGTANPNNQLVVNDNPTDRRGIEFFGGATPGMFAYSRATGAGYLPLSFEATKFTFLRGLTDYANNAAAIAGGLSAGDFYTETGTNPKRVCVVY